jgi:four helix bundle protein
MPVNSFRDLIAWQKAMELADHLYDLTDSFPKDEAFGLRLQLRRCAVSIPSNIAESHARHSTKDFIHFLRVARGSLVEAETQLMLSGRRKYVSKAALEKTLKESDELGRVLAGLISSLSD